MTDPNHDLVLKSRLDSLFEEDRQVATMKRFLAEELWLHIWPFGDDLLSRVKSGEKALDDPVEITCDTSNGQVKVYFTMVGAPCSVRVSWSRSSMMYTMHIDELEGIVKQAYILVNPE